MRRPLLTLSLSLPLLIGGCSFSIGTNLTDPAPYIQKELENRIGQSPESVTCEGKVKAEVGSKTNCTVKFSYGQYSTPVEVSELQENSTRAVFEFLQPLSKEDIAQRAKDLLAQEVGYPPEKFTCEHALLPETGQSVQCLLEHEGQTLPTDVSVTGVDGQSIKFDVQVSDHPS